jgi:hypothetical protein
VRRALRTARVALSYVDVEGAKKNFDAELGEDFDTTREAAATAWRGLDAPRSPPRPGAPTRWSGDRRAPRLTGE